LNADAAPQLKRSVGPVRRILSDKEEEDGNEADEAEGSK
jgi:hypothetical protein